MIIGEFLGLDVPHGTRICPVRDGKIWWNPRLGIPYRPMIGTIGCAPAMGVPTTGPAGDHCGNMGIKEVTEGNTLCLPVSLGRGQSSQVGAVPPAQGDGELCTTALEMPRNGDHEG